MNRIRPSLAAARAVPSAHARPRHARGYITAAALLGVLVLLPTMLSPAYVRDYYLALVLTTLTLLPLAFRMASGTFDVFEPIIMISLLICLTFGIRAIYIVYNPVMLRPELNGTLPFIDYIDDALLVAIGAYLALLVGYFVLGPRIRVTPLWARRRPAGTWPSSMVSTTKVGVLLAVGVVGSAFLDPSVEEVTASTNVIGIMGDFVQTTACLLMLYVAAGDTRLWLRAAIWGMLLPLAAWQSLVLGAKSHILKAFYVLLAARHYVKRPYPAPLLVAGALGLALVVFPVVNSARDARGRLPSLLTDITAGDYVRLAADGVLSRSTGIDVLSLVLKYDVADELGNAEAYAYIPVYAFIPRLIWPDKPVLTQGTNFGRLLLVPDFEGRRLQASFGMFHIGDLFVSFGLIGVFVGMCALGCLYRLVYVFFDPRHPQDPGIRLLYIMLLWLLVSGFQADIPSTYANLLKAMLVWVAVKVWLNQRTSDRAMRRAPVGVRRPAYPQNPGLLPPAARSRLAR